MKKITLFLLLAFSSVFCSQSLLAQQQASDMISFEEDQKNFGKIPQGTPVFHEFKFENKLNKPVIVENVLTSCGCTTPEWDKSPVAPGKTSIVKVGYNAASLGNFNKSIQVFLKDSNIPYILRILGEVVVINPAALNEDKKTDEQKKK